MIVLHAAGGPKLGLGHLARSASVLRALNEAGVQARLVAEAPEAYPVVSRLAGCGVEWASDRAAALRTRGHLLRDGSGIVATDLLHLDASDSALARAQGARALASLNDDDAGGYDADLWIDTDLVPRLAQRRLHSEVLGGADYHVLRHDLVARRTLAASPAIPARSILLTFGGADPGFVTERLLAQAGAWPDIELRCVVGAAMEAARVARLRTTHAGVQFLDGRDDLPAMLASSDLVVTLGGLTSVEAMFLGRPVACVEWGALADHVRTMADARWVASLGPASGAALRLRELAVDVEALARLAQRGAALDGLGAQRVAAALIDLERRR